MIVINDYLTYLVCYTIEKHAQNKYIKLDKLYTSVLIENKNISFLTKYLKPKIKNSSIILKSKSRFKYWINKKNIFYRSKVTYSLNVKYNKQLKKENIFFTQCVGKEFKKLSMLAEFYFNLNNYEFSMKYLNDILNINKTVFKNNKHIDVARTYQNIASIYQELGKHKKALKYAKKSFKINKKIFGIEHRDTLISYNYLGSIYSDLDKYQKALCCYKKAVKTQKFFLGTEDIDTATSYNNIGSTYSTLGKYKKALKYFKKTAEIEKKILGIDNTKTAIAFNNIGSTYSTLGKYKKALKYFKKNLKIHKKNLEYISIATSYNNISIIYLALSEYTKALKYQKKSLKIRKENLGNKHINTSIAYNNIASIYSDLNEYFKSLKYHKKAVKIKEEFFGKNHTSIASSYTNIGSTYSFLGNYNKALNYYKKAIKIQKKIFGKEHINTIITNNMINSIYIHLGKYKKALKYQKKILRIVKKTFGIKHKQTARFYNSYASIFTKLGKYTKALKYHKKALKIQKEIFETDNIDIANSYHHIGFIYGKLERYSDSLKYFKHTLQIQKRIFGTNHGNIAIIYNNLSLMYLKITKYKKAFTYTLLSIFIKKNLMQKNNILNKQETVLYKNYLNLYKSLLLLFKITPNYLNMSSLHKHQRIIQKLYNPWLNYNGSFQDEEALLSIVSSHTNDKQLLSKIDSLKNKQYYLAKLLQDQTPQNTQAIIDKVKNEISEIEIYLAKHIERFKQEQELNNLDYTEISSNLLVEQVFIDFAFGEDNLYIFIIHHDENINFIEVSKEDTNLIKENIRNFRTNITTTMSQMTRDSIKTKKEEVNEILKLLYDTLMKKYLNEYINKYKKLIISQDGLLNQLPFEALYNGEEYLLHKKDITYIASGKEFIRLHRFSDLSNEDLSIDIFADPDYDLKVNTKKDDEDDIGLSSFRTTRALDAFSLCKPLPNTKIEAEAIQKTTQLANLFIEREADEHNLKSLSNAKILHIATHGMVVENEDEQEPLLKCALALTGYNTSIKEKKDYGVFTGLKIASLDLRNTDLVVLSTCESAKGQNDSTEGVASLSRAFMMAGANATIASLWEAHDAMTQQFFTSYYSKLKTQTNYAKVFKETQLEMLSKCKEQDIEHPLFWACFCYFGT